MRSSLNLRHIEAFRAVMLTGTISAAASAMHITQPAISQTLALLERQLGFKLFERRGRRLFPTAEAQTLFREVDRLFIGAERIGQLARDIRHQRSGTMRVASLPALSMNAIPKALKILLDSRPAVTITVQSLPSRMIADLASSGQIDVGFVELPISRAGVTVEPLNDLQSVVLMPQHHRLATKKQVEIVDLHNERIVLLAQHSYMGFQIEEALSKANAIPLVIAETPNSLIAGALVSEGLGITVMPTWAAKSFEGFNVVARPLATSIATRLAAIFPAGTPASSLARVLVNELRELIAHP